MKYYDKLKEHFERLNTFPYWQQPIEMLSLSRELKIPIGTLKKAFDNWHRAECARKFRISQGHLERIIETQFV